MRAMVLEAPGRPLVAADTPGPEPAEGQVLVRVLACGVCRTDLHLLDGEVDVPHPPRVLGHQIIGEVIEGAGGLEPGARVGVPWLGWTDGSCRFCTSGRENLCVQARFTGRDIDGGYAEYAVADARYCFSIPEGYPDLQAAPLLCAGLIGYRALRLAGDAERVGLYGFGASAHILTQVARHQGRRVFALTPPGHDEAQAFGPEPRAGGAGGSGADGGRGLSARAGERGAGAAARGRGSRRGRPADRLNSGGGRGGHGVLECLDDRRIELRPGDAANLEQCVRRRQGNAVG